MRGGTLAVVAALLLAGCAGDGLEEEPEPTERAGPDDQAADEVPRPGWSVGDWWTYDITVARDFSGLPWSTELSPTILVVGSDSQGYATTVTTREDAVTRYHWGDVWGGNHAIDLDPRVPVDAADGTRAESVADLYEWPMTLNKTWRGIVQFGYGGATVEGGLAFVVTSIENQTILNDEDRVATVVGSGELTTSASPDPEPYEIEYQFAEDVGNVVSLTITNTTLTALSMTLTASGGSYTGDAVLLGFEPVYFGLKIVAPGATNAQTAPHPESFEQESEYTFMDVFSGIGLFSQGQVTVRVASPAGETFTATAQTTGEASFGASQQASAPGTWGVSYEQTAISFAAVGVNGVHETTLAFEDGTPSEIE